MMSIRKSKREKKKNNVLSFMKKNGRSPTSKIGIFIGLPSNYVNSLLNELEAEGKLTRQQETNSTYWIINSSNNSKTEEVK